MSQIGEAIAALMALLGLEPEEGVALVAGVTEVTVFNCLPACRDKAPISTPHWKRDEDAAIVDDWADEAKKLGVRPGPYSKRAAVLVMNRKAKLKVKVKVIKSVKVSGDATLTGVIGDLTFKGTCPTGAGEHTVDVTLDAPPATMRAYSGRIRWMLETTSPPLRISGGGSLIELYFVMAKPREMFDAQGVWIELLRVLFGRVGVSRVDAADVVFSKVTAYNFRSHGLKYDTDSGAPQYFDWGANSFSLDNYIHRTSEICNCYDQASAVQVFAGALGCASDWLYLQPFGYIKMTDLIGYGTCNNPFFGSDLSLKVVSPHDKRRQTFGNHAFPGPTATHIADSCAGPHLGGETRPQYIHASIDDDLTLPRYQRGSIRPGTAADIVKRPGVLSVQ